MKVELNERNITMDELELLENLMSRMCYKYQGCEVRNKMTDRENNNIDKAYFTIVDLIQCCNDEGYTGNQAIK
jgi:hypothetical protein